MVSSGQWNGVSSFEQTAPMPVREQSGDRPWAGSEPRSSALIARRSAFTGRVTYVDPTSPRALRRRVPRPILASASMMAIAVGIAVSTANTPPAQPTPELRTFVAHPADASASLSGDASRFR